MPVTARPRALLLALVVSAAAHAQHTVLETCPPQVKALVLRFDGAPPPEVAGALASEVAVEAQRLGLVACWAAEQPVATTTVAWSADRISLESTLLGDPPRTLSRTVPVPPRESTSALLELSVVLGELVRETIAPSVPVVRAAEPPVPTPRSPWSLGAQVSYRVAPTMAGHLFGAAGGVAHHWGRAQVELLLGGGASLPGSSPAGSVSAAGLDAELSMGVTVFEGQALSVGFRGGVSAWLLRFFTQPNAPAIGTDVWAPAVTALLGLEGSWRLGGAALTARVGGVIPLVVATARADGVQVLGVGGPGVGVSLGVGWRLGR